jgi:hypothetical protein
VSVCEKRVNEQEGNGLPGARQGVFGENSAAVTAES